MATTQRPDPALATSVERLCDGRVEKRTFPPKDRFERSRVSYYGTPRDLMRLRVASPKQVVRGERAWKCGGARYVSQRYWRSYFDDNGMVELLVVQQHSGAVSARRDVHEWHYFPSFRQRVIGRLAGAARNDRAFQRFLGAAIGKGETVRCKKS